MNLVQLGETLLECDEGCLSSHQPLTFPQAYPWFCGCRGKKGLLRLPNCDINIFIRTQFHYYIICQDIHHKIQDVINKNCSAWCNWNWLDHLQRLTSVSVVDGGATDGDGGGVCIVAGVVP